MISGKRIKVEHSGCKLETSLDSSGERTMVVITDKSGARVYVPETALFNYMKQAYLRFG